MDRRVLEDPALKADARLADTVDPEQLARASYRDVTLRRWHRDRLVVLGDAAHGMSPQLGRASTWR